MALAQRPLDLTPKTTEAREYAACMQLARIDPRAAHTSALAWRKAGGGDAAIHCVAVAVLGLGQYSQAATMLEELGARGDPARPDLKAGLLNQAANAWMITGRPEKALKLTRQAIKLQPGNIELYLDASIAEAGLGRYWKALDALNTALEIDETRADALVFRASAWRKVGAPDLADQDIKAALRIRPDNPDALLERGLLQKGRGNIAAARADWMKVLEISVTGPLTDAAKQNLETIDVKIDRPNTSTGRK
jgi:tetratricopeptide (TPR) repeat protein